MAYWLLKTEPGVYSWQDLVRDRRTVWDGITNALALQNLRRSSRGDRAIIYHTGGQRLAMGVARIVKGPYPDPARDDPRMAVVDIAAAEPLPRPVGLAEIKADKAFAGWDLLRLSRLSFVPVPEPMWTRLLELSRIP